MGDSHRELVVLGPVVSDTAGLEAAASAGEVLLSPQTAAALSPADLGPARDDGVLLRGHPSAPRLVLVPPTLPSADYALGVPASIRPHLRGAGQDGEHRLAVTGFVQFKGSDDLLASDGLEAVADELHRLVVAVQEACAAYGVAFMATDVDRNGGKVVLAAGAPVATPDDEDRMLFAVRDVVALRSGLSLRAGVNRGHAFVVDMGAHERRTYAVMGDVTNLAARVMGKAEPGQVLATAAVLDHVSTQFDLEPLPPVHGQGQDRPRVGLRGRAAGRAPAASAPDRAPRPGRRARGAPAQPARRRRGHGPDRGAPRRARDRQVPPPRRAGGGAAPCPPWSR